MLTTVVYLLTMTSKQAKYQMSHNASDNIIYVYNMMEIGRAHV